MDPKDEIIRELRRQLAVTKAQRNFIKEQLEEALEAVYGFQHETPKQAKIRQLEEELTRVRAERDNARKELEQANKTNTRLWNRLQDFGSALDAIENAIRISKEEK